MFEKKAYDKSIESIFVSKCKNAGESGHVERIIMLFLFVEACFSLFCHFQKREWRNVEKKLDDRS